MPLSPSTPVGAFTNLTVAAINAALVQAGIAATTGNVFFCDPVNGLDTNNGQVPASAGVAGVGPVQSLAAGYALLRNGFNDVLVLIGNGQSSGSARITSFTWSKNAAHLIGICAPSAVSQRARIANPLTAGLVITANFFTVSGNGCLFSNLSWFVGAGAGQTGIAASICLTVSGQRNAFLNCDFEGMGDATSAADAGSRNLLLAAGENYFFHCNIGLDSQARTGANASVEISGNSARNIFEDCLLPLYSSDGLQHYVLTAAAAAMDRFTLFRNCMFTNATASGATILAELFKLAAASGGYLLIDLSCNWVPATAVGDATTKALTLMGGVAGTNTGGKMIAAT